eukprot:TRINITY_DN340_c0_g1_i1.p1 TRINITY_DN340_c0_g1~~TRINITY_DN340_c0_g1_i1.p1  ORF type:complete len:790 (-),score=281.46 TRINITY_DN340_c0_g1_i1:42-2333(-)
MSEEDTHTEKKQSTGWVDVQRKAFTRWAAQYLSERMITMSEDLVTELQDGVKLCELLEIISSKSVGTFNRKPKTRYQFLENASRGLNFIKDEGLKLVGIGPEDIVDGKLKLDLGLMWTIILRYQINMIGKGSPKWELLEWVRGQIAPYDLAVKGENLKNFTTNWQDGTVIFALTDSLKEGILTPNDMSGLSRKALDDVEKAMATALSEYNIPRLLDAEDMVNNPDELALMTYISYFRDFLSEEAQRRREEAERRKKTAHPGNCYAFGPGVEGGAAHQPNPFTIQAVNCNGDKLAVGGCHFDVKVEGPKPGEDPSVQDNGDGTYSVNYVVGKGGNYTVSVLLASQDSIDKLPQNHPGWGQHIKDSPYSVEITGANAGSSYATGPGVEGAVVKKDAPFKIHSVGEDGKPLSAGGETFKAVVSGPDNVGDVAIVDNNDGTYDGSYVVAKPGRYQVDITLDGQPIKDSPYNLLVENGNAGNSYAEGPGLEGGQQGKPGVFTIHSVGPDGKPVSDGGDPFKVTVKGPNGDIDPEVTDNGDGTYTVKYTPDGFGDHDIDVTLHDEHIKDAPFKVSIKAAPNAGNSYAEGPGLQEAWDNEPAHFTIHSVDNDGQPRKEGGDPFSVNISGPVDTPVDVKDNGDGTYSVTYSPQEPGAYTINVDLDGSPIKDAPFKVTAKAGTDVTNSDFGIFSFTLQSKDKRGNNKEFGGDEFNVNISGPEGAEVEVQTMDNQDGTYTAVYALAGEGVKGKNFKVRALLNGHEIGAFNQQM